VWQKYRLLLLGSDRPKTLSLRNPRLSVSAGREAVCLLDKFPKACDPDFVSVPVLEYLVDCVVHGRGSFWHGREGQGIACAISHHITIAHGAAKNSRPPRLTVLPAGEISAMIGVISVNG
jgi:hypothetical protein